MRAVVKRDPSPGAEVADAEVPDPGPRDVLLRVEAASVCGTDLDLVNDFPRASATWGTPLPLVLGHEAAGRVVAAGSEVTELAEGDLVVVETHIYCGDCAACRRDAKHNCLNMSIPGVSRDGVFAEYAVIPARACFRIDEGVDAGTAALYEAAGVAAHAIQRAGDMAGRTVAVTGAGPVALFLIAQLRALGVEHIAVMEPGDARRHRALELGAQVFGVDESQEFIDFCRDHGSIAGADVAFEASGAIPAYSTLFQALGRESTLVSIGHSSEPLPVNISRDLNLRVINWLGTFGRHIWSSWHIVDQLVRSGNLKLQEFVVDEIALEDLPARLPEIPSLPGKVLVRP